MQTAEKKLPHRGEIYWPDWPPQSVAVGATSAAARPLSTINALVADSDCRPLCRVSVGQ